MRQPWSWALRVGLTCGAFVYIFLKVPLTEVMSSIAGARVSYLVLAVALAAVARYLTAVQMKFATDRQGLDLSVGQILQVNQTTKFYALFLPGTLSGGLRWYRFSRQGTRGPQALASITFNRILDTITLVAFGLFCWLIDDHAGAVPLIGAVLAALFLGLLALHGMALHSDHVQTVADRLGRGPRRVLSASFRDRLGRLLESAARSYRVCRGLTAPVICFSSAVHVVGILVFGCFALSLGITLSIPQIAWIRTTVGVLSMLPISVAGLGVREGSLIMLLAPYGVSANDAVALSLLFFARGLVAGVMGGLFELKNALRPAWTPGRSG